MATKPNLSDLLDGLKPGEVDALLRNDLSLFTQMAFGVLKPAETLKWAPYLDLLCANLQDVAEGRTPRLIVTVPPRFLKSICGSVALPAFFLGHNPSAEVMCVSYGMDLAAPFGEQTRALMVSPTYKRLFDTRLASERAAPRVLRTSAGGVRRATSIDGTATGHGANLLIFDDPQKAGDRLSDAIRKATNAAYENTFISRLNDPENVRIVIIMQRLHEDDFVGHVRGLGGDWKLINLPAIAEEDQVWTFETFLGQHEWRRVEGELLHAERFSVARLMERRAEVGEATWATQWQQRPTPAGGGIVKRYWFKRRSPEHWPQTFEKTIQSWDTANTTEEWSHYSVCTTWGIVGNDIFLRNVFRKRMLYGDLKRAVFEQANLFKPATVLVENRASGQQLLQELPEAGFQIAIGVDPDGDKEMRMATQVAVIENGFVHVPDDAAWVPEYLYEMEVFPNGKYFDQVDSTSQFLFWRNNVRMKGWGVYEHYRREAERLQRGIQKKDVAVVLVPEDARHRTFFGKDGHRLTVEPDGCIRTSSENAAALLSMIGFRLVE